MTIKGLLYSFGSIAAIAGIVVALNVGSPAKYQPRNDSGKFEGIHGAMAYMASIRNNVITGEFDPADAISAENEVNRLAKYQQRSVSINWQEMGPDNVGGRTRAILVDRVNHLKMFAGGVGGGLFVSTTGGSSWVPVNDMARSPAISCITQSPVNNYIYVGTGEGFANYGGDANGSSGFPGKGIYRSMNGVDFELLPFTIPADTNNTSAFFNFVNELAVDPSNGRVYAACNSGFWVSDNNGDTWTRTKLGKVTDVQVATDRTVVIALNNKFNISTDFGETFTSPSGSPSPTGRMEIAIAPSDPNYIYLSCANSAGQMFGVYRSTDKGNTWTQIGPGGSQNFQPFRNQGGYNNIISVYPDNKNKIILGGIDLWEWQVGGTWTQKTLWALNPTSSLYIHADHHTYVFHPNYKTTSNPTGNEIIYYGSDGGVSRSTNGGQTFHTLNINYNTVQFYTISASGQGEIVGGTQDNGTLYNDLDGNTIRNFTKIQGGDGGWAAISLLNHKAFYTTTYNGGALRSPDMHATASEWFSLRMLSLGTPGEDFPAGFVTPQIIWESINFPTPHDSAMFVADQVYSAGTTVTVRSNRSMYPFPYVLPVALNQDDTLYVPDIIESRFFLGGNGHVWMTRQNLDFSKTPEWIRIANITGLAQCMTISKDGNYLWVGTAGGRVYRISNLLAAKDSANADVEPAGKPSVLTVEQISVATGNRTVTSIAVDPSNADRVIVTVGNYGSSSPYIFFSSNATSATPTFSGKQGTGVSRLPYMPVYASTILMHRANTVIIGTEYGLFATDNINVTNPVWEEVNNGASRVPVHMLFQQIYNFASRTVSVNDNGTIVTTVYPGVTNYGAIYAGTHGRGSYRCDNFVGIGDDDMPSAKPQAVLGIYPNPATDHFQAVVSLPASGSATLSIHDISGRLIRNVNLNNLKEGDTSVRVSTEGLSNGSYIVRLRSGSYSSSAKLLVWN
jgi:hypothetical protein